METRLGQDFSDVRIHTGQRADHAARSINATAFTSGNDIGFANGVYSPHTASGKQVLAHELTHVVQQRSGPVSATPVGGGIALSDPADAFERAAETTAARAIAGRSPMAAPGPAGPTSAHAQPVQRLINRAALGGLGQSTEATRILQLIDEYHDLTRFSVSSVKAATLRTALEEIRFEAAQYSRQASDVPRRALIKLLDDIREELGAIRAVDPGRQADEVWSSAIFTAREGFVFVI
jgi:hypothetical protein